MARCFTVQEAQRLLGRHHEIKEDFQAAYKSLVSYVPNAGAYVDDILRHKAIEQLKSAPIEELNRNKLGLRLRALKDHGYNSIADVVGMPSWRLQHIPGIGPATADTICSMVRKIVEDTSKGIKIPLSLDDKNRYSSSLVLIALQYKQAEQCYQKAADLKEKYSNKIDKAIQDIQPGLGFFKWLFTSGYNKDKANEAYRYLNDAIASAYAQTVKDITSEVKRIEGLTFDDAWREYEANPIQIINTIEKIYPGVLGKEKSDIGLSIRLLSDIQTQSLDKSGLKCELRAYQEFGVKYILHQQKVLLGDEMGLGKTVEAIAAMVMLRNSGGTHFMVVCPASVLSNWYREIFRHSDLYPVYRIYGESKFQFLRLWIRTGGVALTTYETTSYITSYDLPDISMLVADEAHYIKNPNTHRSINVRKISSFAQMLLLMTGTPLENKVTEMITLIRYLQPKIADDIYKVAYLANAPQFREKIAPVYLRRKREDVLGELPELIESEEWCSLGKKEETAYELAVLRHNFSNARCVSWNVDDLTCSSKANRMLEIIEQAEEDERKIVVYSFFLDTIRKICDLLGDRCVHPITGAVSPDRRQDILDLFDRMPAGTVLPAQIMSGGIGLNIQSASVVIICEPQFKPSSEDQAIARVYRMRQSRRVLVYRLLCENTVDERIKNMLEKKKEIFNQFADKSAASEKFGLDDNAFSTIMEDEYNRIIDKNDGESPQSLP